jgi:hypothetical protein
VRAFLGAVGLRDCIGPAQTGIEGGACGISRGRLRRVLDAQFLTKVEYQCGKARRRLAPANKRGVALRVGIESPHEGCQPIRWRKKLYPPSALFGSVFDDRYPGRPILHDYSFDFESRGVPFFDKTLILLKGLVLGLAGIELSEHVEFRCRRETQLLLEFRHQVDLIEAIEGIQALLAGDHADTVEIGCVSGLGAGYGLSSRVAAALTRLRSNPAYHTDCAGDGHEPDEGH